MYFNRLQKSHSEYMASLKGTYPLHLGVNIGLIINIILKKCGVRIWTGEIYLKVKWQAPLTTVTIFGLQKIRRTSWLYERLLTLQEWIFHEFSQSYKWPLWKTFASLATLLAFPFKVTFQASLILLHKECYDKRAQYQISLYVISQFPAYWL
jgi:hypothetical protein